MDADVRKRIIVIVAVASNGVIGNKGEIPWKIRSDMNRFAKMTNGNTVVMGSNTMRSIIAKIGGPLANRENIVITKHPLEWVGVPGVKIASSPEEAIHIATHDGIFICGGPAIYEAFLDKADELWITEVAAEPEGDAFFPDWNREQWNMADELIMHASEKDQFDTTYRCYRRNDPIIAKRYVELGNARLADQREAMLRIAERGECPFCEENFLKEHKKPILFKGEHWIVTESQWPYEAAAIHLLLVSRKHAEKIGDLSTEAGAELIVIAGRLEAEYGIESGALAIRFGDPSKNGGSVNHLHVHLMVPDEKKGKPLFFWINPGKPELR